MIKIGICDSGEFANSTGKTSAPRIYSSVFEEVFEQERLHISAISYIQSAPGKRLPVEPVNLQEMRNKDKWKIEKRRVLNTAKTFVEDVTDIDRNFENSDIVLIVMRPSNRRLQLIRRAVESGKSVLVFPPYFSDRDELYTLLSESEHSEVILWLPYRFSVAATELMHRFQKSEKIAAMELTVVSAPYLTRVVICEWALPFLDAMRMVAGRFDKVTITRTIASGLPVFHMQSIHRNSSNYILSSSLITTAGGTLQNTEAGRLKIYSTEMESIETTQTFTGFIHRTNTLHQFTEVSHDQQSASLTGYSDLLRRCLDDRWDDTHVVKPTVASFAQMQRVLDVFSSFDDEDGEAFLESPQTKEITF